MHRINMIINKSGQNLGNDKCIWSGILGQKLGYDTNDQEAVMKGTKSSDKCYTWTPQNNGPEIACLSAKEDIDKMSHQMSQHLYNG